MIQRKLSAIVKHKLFKWIWLTLEGIVIVLMAIVIWQARSTLVDTFRTARYEYFIWTFVFYTIAIVLVSIGWHLVMCHLGAQRDLILNIKTYVYTLIARRLPIPLGHIASRVVFYKRMGVPVGVCAFASAIEVLLSVVSGLMVGAWALLVLFDSLAGALLWFVLFESLGLILLHPRILRWILARFNYQVPAALTTLQVLSWVGLYIAMWIAGGMMTGSVILAIYPLAASDFPLITSFWALTGALAFVTFLLPSSFGVSEITLSLLLGRIMPLPIAISTAVLIRVLTMAFDICWSSLIFLDRESVFQFTKPE